MKEKKEKPYSLVLIDSKQEIVDSINKIANENGLSFYFLEQIVRPIYEEIVNQAGIEVQNLREQYETREKEVK